MAKLQSVGSVAGKETIYVDVDDEITTVIDKVQSAKGKVVALVLPKRATVLQSIVNMKLLKRTADNAAKNLVLVTTEAGLMPLAGSVGMYVADSPSSKPVVPPAPVGPSDEPEDIDEPLNIVDGSGTETADFDAAESADKPVGELAAAGVASKIAEKDIDEDINLEDNEAAPAAAAGTAATAAKLKKDKKLAVPNFTSFRNKLLIAAAALVLLIVLSIFALVVLPKAKVTIHTNSSTVPSNLNLALDTTAKTLNTNGNVVPATAVSQQKTGTQQVAASGQQNNGQKATGTVTMSAGSCSGDVPNSVPAGTSLTASNHTFTLDSDVNFSPTVSHGKCTFTGMSSGSTSISITALRGGADYNTGSTSFTVSGRSDVSASGSASGGTDNITKIVTQSDIDSATSKIKAADNSAVKDQLAASLQGKGLQAVQVTYLAGAPQVTTSAKAGDAADTVTVTAVTVYTMLGIQDSDLRQLVVSSVTSQIDKAKQIILDDGIANAVFTLQGTATATNAPVQASVKSAVGPQIDVAQLKPQLAGKKTGDVKSLLDQTPGITGVDVHYSPFWVGSVPKSTKKITVIVDKPSTKQ